jgi:hypothetical protein
MKKWTKGFGAVLLILTMALSVSGVAQVQQPVNTHFGATFDKVVGVGLPTQFGFYNEVTATARHCADYVKQTGHLWWKSSYIDAAACEADPSTVFAVKKNHNLTTNAGKDAIKQQVLNTGSQPAACGFIAISTSAVTPAAGDTTLTGEVATNGGARASGTYASTGTGTATLTKVFTATGAITSVQAAAVFNASSAGSMCFEVGSLGPVTLANTDTLTVTWSGTISKLLSPEMWPEFTPHVARTDQFASAYLQAA